MRALPALFASTALALGAAGGVATFRALSRADAPVTVPVAVSQAAAPQRIVTGARVRWAPCRPPAELRHGHCVTDVVKTVTVTVPAQSAPAPPAPAPTLDPAPVAPAPTAAPPAYADDGSAETDNEAYESDENEPEDHESDSDDQAAEDEGSEDHGHEGVESEDHEPEHDGRTRP